MLSKEEIDRIAEEILDFRRERKSERPLPKQKKKFRGSPESLM